MKVIQSLGWYFPESTGGSEIYVSSLIADLLKLSIESGVVAPTNGTGEQQYMHSGASVFRYPVTARRSRVQRVGSAPHTGFDRFERWLDSQSADIYHQHSWTYGCGIHHLQAAQRRGMATVLTVHVPGLVCLRGTMLKDGATPCDGQIRERECAHCWLQQRGMPAAGRAMLGSMPAALGSRLRFLGKAGTALAATSLVQRHRMALLQAAEAADHVVAVCQWLHDALLRNGVPAHKLSLNRQGVASAPALANECEKRSDGSPLVVGFLGRWDPLKGLGVLVQAVLRLPADIPFELHIHAVESQDPDMARHMHSVRAAAAGSPRIKLFPALAPDAVPAFLRSIDLLAVPSQWFETGPLVALEAFAMGTPVIGSDLGGISELVRHGQNGWLVRHDDVSAWTAALGQLARQPALLPRLRQGIGPVRTMRDVALETRSLYFELLQSKAST